MKMNDSKLAAVLVFISLLSVSATVNADVCMFISRTLDIENSGGSNAAAVHFKEPYMEESGAWYNALNIDGNHAMLSGSSSFSGFGEVATIIGSCDSKWKVKISCSQSSGYTEYTMGGTTTSKNVTVSAKCSNSAVTDVTFTP